MSGIWLISLKTALSLVALLYIGGCDTDTSNVVRPSIAALGAAAHPQQTTVQLWSRSCALCHVDGNASAPRIGNVEEWRPRLAKGREVLLEHTLKGFGQMPPLGYCMACERDDFLALIDFMTIGVVLDAVGSEHSAAENTVEVEPRS